MQACWDTGHANLNGPQVQEILAVGKHLRAIHLNDNSGITDDHMLPGQGTMDVDGIMDALMEVGFQGPLTLECDGYLRAAKKDPTRAEIPPIGEAEAHLRTSLAISRSLLKTYGLTET